MARIRTIKPESPQSENLGRCSRDARLLFFMLFTVVDDEGRGRAAPQVLAGQLFPYDDDARTHIVQWLFELERENCVTLYEVDGTAYLEIKKWLQHQKIDRASPSRLPPPSADTRERSTKPRESSMLYLVPSTVDQKELSEPPAAATDQSKPKAYPEDFEKFWAGYPTDKNMAKKAAFKRWKALSPEQRTSALAAVPAFRAYCEQNKSWYRPKHAEGWLAQERFDGFLTAGEPDPGISPERLAELQDKTDRALKRGKYAETYQ